MGDVPSDGPGFGGAEAADFSDFFAELFGRMGGAPREGGVADEDAQHEGRQQVDELAERRRNRQAAELIARQ